jgi:cytidylate kinase
VLNIFISSTDEERIKRLCQLHNITEDKARDMMEKCDRKRSTFYNYYSYKTWGAAASYNLCIDSSLLGIDGTVDFIEEFVRKTLQIK